MDMSTAPRWRSWEAVVDPDALSPVARAAAVGAWFLECPGAHPLWDQYLVTLIHLRPFPGAPAPVLYARGATHEIILLALNPKVRMGRKSKTTEAKWINPPNFVGQFIAEHDAAAREKVERVIAEVEAGRLSPDSDARIEWKKHFPLVYAGGFS